MIPSVLLIGLPDGTGEWLEAHLGITVRSADSLAAALESLREERFSLLAVAETLTDSTGEAVVTALRADPSQAGTPVVFCLGRTPDARLAARLVQTHRVDRLLVDPPKRLALIRQIADMLGLEVRTPRRTAEPGARLSAGMAALWERFRDQVFQRVETLERTGSALLEGSLEEEARRAAEREAHKLAGSVGTFGFAEGSAIAHGLERILAGSRRLGPDDIERYLGLVRDLREELTGPRPVDGVALEPKSGESILIVDVEPEFGRRLQSVAGSSGFGARVVSSAVAQRLMTDGRPELVIVDATPDERWSARIALMRVLASCTPAVPVIVLGDEESGIRRSAPTERHDTLFLRKPVSPEQVLAEGQKILGSLRPERGRVLVVDDDPQVLEVVRTILRREGFEVSNIGDPIDLLSSLESDPPDLLILDLDMPHLSGIELCTLVRGHDKWQSVPVVLLTANRDGDVVERVFAAGADDFVLKPLVGPELVTRVANRLERARLYRAMAETDYLTGVANRRKSTDQFHQLNRLALRNNKPLSFAILDLDRFKGINDRFGHGIGDRVLRDFAAFLLRNFRDSDVVGRWGGEEFVLGLYGMTRDQCSRRLERAIEDFHRIPIEDGCGGVLNITFSAGIAEFPFDGENLQSLYLAADRALYRAKEGGRARVERVAAVDREANPDPSSVHLPLLEVAG